MAEYQFRLANTADRAAITGFVRHHWAAAHPLVELPDFFDYYYKAEGDALRFALAEQDGALAALAGFIPASRRPQPDVWVSLWVADPAARGSGLELMDALPQLTGCRTLACNNIRPETQPFYTFLGYATGRVGHFYRLAQRRQYRLARIAEKDIPPVGGAARLHPLPTPEAQHACGFVPPEGANPYKDLWYIERRFFAFPRQSYRLYAATLPQETVPRALLATRVTRAMGTAALRIVDYIGPADFLPEMGGAIDELMRKAGAEYADLYCAGLPADLLRQAGFAERAQDAANILPTYLDPPVIENVDFHYFTSRPQGFVLFKADGDQDRPNTPL
ncbi:MAG: N-acetyltransferase family protein [Oscillospiraceae bacterium]